MLTNNGICPEYYQTVPKYANGYYHLQAWKYAFNNAPLYALHPYLPTVIDIDNVCNDTGRRYIRPEDQFY